MSGRRVKALRATFLKNARFAPQRGELRRAKKNLSHRVQLEWHRIARAQGERWLSLWRAA